MWVGEGRERGCGFHASISVGGRGYSLKVRDVFAGGEKFCREFAVKGRLSICGG